MVRYTLSLLIWILFTLGSVAADRPPANLKPNRLANEASPYLRQHAYNPVDWYPWGEEAFRKARDEHKPIFLSVGYSTCHWCHVMERESFSDKKIAEYLNKYFVAIKVDRERRPDVDETYMIATELMTQRGGWPNSVFLLPDLKPFYAGTYFPKEIFLQVLTSIAVQWETNNIALGQQAAEVARIIETVMAHRVAGRELTAQHLQSATSEILDSLDEFYGGFSEAPKFPQETLLLFLARRALQPGEEGPQKALELTLTAILNGGIHDHIGGGFHRYSVDNEWRVPHFEKMLYNQALMTMVLTKAYQISGNSRYRQAVHRTLNFVLSEMTNRDGAFHSAFDADSDGHEGTYYVWTPQTLQASLGKKKAEFATRIFGVTPAGNFERETTVLHFPNSPETMANELGLDESRFFTRVDEIRKGLLVARKKRISPLRDDKIVASWNGLVIAALAEAADQFGDERYEQAAIKAAEFMWTRMRSPQLGLARVFFENRAALEGSQVDYALFAKALLALYDLTGDKRWLSRAEMITDEMVQKFQDKEAGDFYRTAQKVTFARGKTRNDTQIPSGNAVALEVFSKLMRRSTDPEHRQQGEALLSALSGLALDNPAANAYALLAADEFLNGEPGSRIYLAKGTVRATVSLGKEGNHLKLRLAIAPGWHVNSNSVLEDFLIPTTVKVTHAAGGGTVRYPEAARRRLAFHHNELSLYEGEVEILVPLNAVSAGELVKAELTLQACSDQICLEPETGVLVVFSGKR